VLRDGSEFRVFHTEATQKWYVYTANSGANRAPEYFGCFLIRCCAWTAGVFSYGAKSPGLISASLGNDTRDAAAVFTWMEKNVHESCTWTDSNWIESGDGCR
jgi:hypothetical protein